ncbi:hypothetical protein RYZ26_19150 [Terasakiella sp. A23]|uniref:hypothetical protein n=1 Tax=Terasakiella sp. FCG-A23 TaxID=3080561 RepID=UPI00295492B5|nr:hypothetical protein [Terasakiella sp. A23]MDV7341727.1 hypothetical protein [Terasakiella sp. A23]
MSKILKVGVYGSWLAVLSNFPYMFYYDSEGMGREDMITYIWVYSASFSLSFLAFVAGFVFALLSFYRKQWRDGKILLGMMLLVLVAYFVGNYFAPPPSV